MLAGVQILQLDYNLIKCVDPLFVIAFSLQELSLKGNRIRHFDTNSNQLIHLTYLDLSNNILSLVHIWEVINLELRLTHNPNDFELECNTQLTDLRFNKLQSGQIKQKIIISAMLLLDYNLLVDLNFLSAKHYLRTLKYLSCSHNLIRTINEEFFESAINLERLVE
ncbi:hypothetical protein GJ496_010226 [Pomphorhynchus laevis]|nr:hypothetical protein GJ496_010226 [Pomphorhynchus laevis]